MQQQNVYGELVTRGPDQLENTRESTSSAQATTWTSHGDLLLGGGEGLRLGLAGSGSIALLMISAGCRLEHKLEHRVGGGDGLPRRGPRVSC